MESIESTDLVDDREDVREWVLSRGATRAIGEGVRVARAAGFSAAAGGGDGN
jgi:hypothetical protein